MAWPQIVAVGGVPRAAQHTAIDARMPRNWRDSRRRCYIFWVRRLIAICLLMLLPFQFSWAAVADYCAHESDPQAQHLGHHEHHDSGHADAVNAADGEADVEQPAVDNDGCHSHGCCVGLTGSRAAMFTGPPVATPSPVAEAATGALLANPPDRPQWARLA